MVMPIMKDIFHNKILKKGNEMIAFDHIVPLRIMFPTGTGDVSPHLTTNLSNWKNKIDVRTVVQLSKKRDDESDGGDRNHEKERHSYRVTNTRH